MVAQAAIIRQESAAIERSPLTGAATQLRSLSIGHSNNPQSTTQYGTLLSPPYSRIEVPLPPPSLQLPEPMQSLDIHSDDDFAKMGRVRHIPGGPDISITRCKLFSFHKNKDLTSFTMATSRPALLKRMVSTHWTPSTTVVGQVVNVDDIREEAIEEFFEWLESELEKINVFYKEKKEENERRLEELKEQLQIMEVMKLAEIRGETVKSSLGTERGASGDILRRGQAQHQFNSTGVLQDTFNPEPSASKTRRAESTPYLTNRPSPQHPDASAHCLPLFTTNRDNYQTAKQYTERFSKRKATSQLDYRPPMKEITYQLAKRRLKLAMIEFYRGLELLKSYCHQNQEGFRKIAKKFDKSTGLRTSKKFMSEKVNQSYFVLGDLDSLIQETEDSFSRYFERGDRKTAVQKLRSKEKSKEFYGSTFRSGILLGLGFFAAVQGVLKATASLGKFKAAPGLDKLEHNTTNEDKDPISYLLQVCHFYPRID